MCRNLWNVYGYFSGLHMLARGDFCVSVEPSVGVWVFLCFKRRNPVKKLVAQDTKAPYIYTCIMLDTLHCEKNKHTKVNCKSIITTTYMSHFVCMSGEALITFKNFGKRLKRFLKRDSPLNYSQDILNTLLTCTSWLKEKGDKQTTQLLHP